MLTIPGSMDAPSASTRPLTAPAAVVVAVAALEEVTAVAEVVATVAVVSLQPAIFGVFVTNLDQATVAVVAVRDHYTLHNT